MFNSRFNELLFMTAFSSRYHQVPIKIGQTETLFPKEEDTK